MDLASRGPGADVDAFNREIRNIVSGVLYKPTERKGVALAFYQVLLAGASHGIQFPTDLILLGKAFYTLETMGLRLFPEIDLAATFKPYVSQAFAHELSPRRLVASAQGEAFDAMYFLKHLPERTQALLDQLERGSLSVKIDLQELHDLKTEFDRQNDVRVLAVLAVALLIGSAIVLRVDQRAAAYGVPLGAASFIASAVLVLWLFLLIRRRPKP
jgi:ubiquinone biosynthesis protein